MKTFTLNIVVFLFLTNILPNVFGQQNYFNSASNQKENPPIQSQKSIDIKFFVSSKGANTYAVKIAKKWVRGVCKFQGTGKPHALFSDLNFDGIPDIWVTGFTDSQGRSRCSDVWLFNSKNKKYEYNVEISKINNLEVAPLEKKLSGGVSNCGCAGQCFYHDIYAWEDGTLLKIARREQQCDIDAVLYQEFILMDGKLKSIRQEKGIPNKNEYLRRQNGDLEFLNWQEH